MTANKTTVDRTPTRRQIVMGIAMAAGSLAGGRTGLAQQPAAPEKTTANGNEKRTSLHQEIDLKAAAQRVFEILLDSKQFAAMTGMAAEIDPNAGGAFKMFNGMIGGRNVEIIAGQRLVQAWRPASWDSGVYSIVHFELKTRGSESTMVLDHSGFPEGDYDHLYFGWGVRYWDPMKKYLAQGA